LIRGEQADSGEKQFVSTSMCVRVCVCVSRDVCVRARACVCVLAFVRSRVALRCHYPSLWFCQGQHFIKDGDKVFKN
jgi:hypothetical protein